MKKIPYISTILALTLVFTSCGNDANAPQINLTPIAVTTASVAEQNASPWVNASGKIEAVNSANLSTRNMGYVDKIYVKVGEKVNKGQLLISLNNADLSAKKAQTEAAIIEAKAAFNSSEKDYKRYQNLFAENSASRKELDDMTARYEMAKARLDAAQQMKNEVEAQFAYSNIRSPFNGVVTNRFIDEGAMANPGMPLIAVEGPSAFEAKVSIPESEITKIHRGDTVKVQLKSSGLQLKGAISELSTSALNTGGQYLATISITETSPEILSGMYVNVQFPVAKSSANNNLISIPKTAIVNQGQLTGIYTVSESNTAVLRWIRLGKSNGDSVEVLSGLKPDENYIVSAEGKLYNGAPISVQ